MKLRTLIQRRVLGIGLLLSLSHAAHASAGTDGAAFLNIPVGAGPAAMGSAYSAIATDAYAPIWNPGGLGFLDSTQLAAQHVSYLESISYEFASVVFPLRPGDALGVSVQYLGSGDIPETGPTGASLGSYSDTFGAYSLAYGHAFTDRLALGVTGKLIHITLSDVSATAYAADVGTLWRVSDHLNVSGVLANMGSELTFIDSGDPTPLALRFGAAYSPSKYWIFTGETSFSRTGHTSGRLGMEWRPLDFIALRGGYRTDTLKELSGIAGLSTGLGLLLWGHELAYAWVPYGDLGTSQYLSLVLRFGGPEKRNLIQYQHTKFESDDVSSYFHDELDSQRINDMYRKKSDQSAQAAPSEQRISQ